MFKGIKYLLKSLVKKPFKIAMITTNSPRGMSIIAASVESSLDKPKVAPNKWNTNPLTIIIPRLLFKK